MQVARCGQSAGMASNRVIGRARHSWAKCANALGSSARGCQRQVYTVVRLARPWPRSVSCSGKSAVPHVKNRAVVASAMPWASTVRYQGRLAKRSSLALRKSPAASLRPTKATRSPQRVPGIAYPFVNGVKAVAPAPDVRHELHSWRARGAIEPGRSGRDNKARMGECNQRPPHVPSVCHKVDRFDPMLPQDGRTELGILPGVPRGILAPFHRYLEVVLHAVSHDLGD